MTLSVSAVEAIPITIPLKRPLKMASAAVHHRESVLVRIHTREGWVGLGEAVPAPYFTGETQLGARYALEQLIAPSLRGREISDLHVLLHGIDRLLWGNPSIKAAVDMALHDLVAKSLGVPLYLLLGGKMRDRVEATWYLFSKEPDRLAEEAMEGVRQGYPAVKIKVGTQSPALDLQCLETVRRAVGDQVEIRADANQAWKPIEAIRFLKLAEEYRLQFVEQPVRRDDLVGMAQVARAVTTPLAPDEGVFGAEDALRHIRAGAADGVVVKLIKTAGLAGARRLAAVLETANLSAHVAGMPGETSVGGAATLHLALAFPSLHWGSGIYPSFAQHDVVTEPLQAIQGHYLPPEGPGLGVELDMQAVAHCRTDR
jgi:o-succinylbenzoate synthase